MTALNLVDLTQLAGGELIGSHEGVTITGAAPLYDVQAGQITLIDDEKHLEQLATSAAAAVVTPRRWDALNIPQIVVAKPHDAFAKICQKFRPTWSTSPCGVHPTAFVHPSAVVHPMAMIAPSVTVDEGSHIGAGTQVFSGVTIMAGCTIGKDCRLYPGVVLYPGTILHDRVILHAGAVMGANGFGYKMVEGAHRLSPQLGWVELESDVEIGANTTIDRGTYGATRIGAGTKIDNLVQIGHNCRLGKHNLVCSQVGIAGSTTTGDYVVLAGQVGLRDHIHIGDRTMVGAQAGVANDIEKDQIVLGSPAIPRFEQAQQFAAISKLPEMRKSLRRLETQVQQLVQAKAA